MRLMTVSASAERLGVTTRQVQHLVARGDLRQVARGVIDEASIDRLLATRGGSHTRAWTEATAWGAISLLCGGSADWMGQTQRSRLGARLRSLSATALLAQARERARVTRYRAHSSSEKYLRENLVCATRGSAELSLTPPNAVDGYVATTDLANTVRNHGLIRDDEGRVTLRSTSVELGLVAELADRGLVLAALDLGESLDVRERRAGLEALDRALETFRG